MVRSLLQKITDRLDLIICAGAFLAGIALAGVAYLGKQQSTLEIAFMLLGACVLYASFRKKIINLTVPRYQTSNSILVLCNIVYFSIILICLIVGQHSLTIPFFYYLLLAATGGLLAFEIISYRENKYYTYWILFKILLISLVIRFGVFYEYAGFFGTDAWWHSYAIDQWVQAGHIERQLPVTYEGYAEFPIMHLNVIAMRLISGLGAKDSLFASIGLVYTVSLPLLFFYAKKILSTKGALLATLLVCFSAEYILRGSQLIPTSLGIVLFTTLIWLSFKERTLGKERLILIVLTLTLVFAHSASSFITMVVLFLMVIANIVIRLLYRIRWQNRDIQIVFFGLYTILMFTHWIYNNYYSSKSFFESIVGSLTYSLNNELQFTGSAFEASTTSAISTLPLNRAGFLILIFLIVLGSLIWLAAKRIDKNKLIIIVITVGLAFITFGLPLFDIKSFVPGRWLPFIYIIAAPIAVQGILGLSRLVNNTRIMILVPTAVFLIFAFFMINNSSVNSHTPFLGTAYMENPHRWNFDTEEMAAVDTLVKVYEDKITTDRQYRVLPFYGRLPFENTTSLEPGSDPGGLTVIREYIYSHQDEIDENVDAVNDLLDQFSGMSYDMVYDNGEVKAYTER